jgi:hypothetical protein
LKRAGSFSRRGWCPGEAEAPPSPKRKRAGEVADYVMPLTTVIMLVAAIATAISISLFAVIASPLFLIAALLAFLGRHKREETIPVQTTQGR